MLIEIFWIIPDTKQHCKKKWNKLLLSLGVQKFITHLITYENKSSQKTIKTIDGFDKTNRRSFWKSADANNYLDTLTLLIDY